MEHLMTEVGVKMLSPVWRNTYTNTAFFRKINDLWENIDFDNIDKLGEREIEELRDVKVGEEKSLLENEKALWGLLKELWEKEKVCYIHNIDEDYIFKNWCVILMHTLKERENKK